MNQVGVIGALRLGVIVPCRNEEAVIARKLANLARVRWPDAEHRLVIVDDASDDETFERATSASQELFGGEGRIDARVVVNAVRAGKPGAVRQGLAELENAVDLVLLTDADVVLAPDALQEIASAFQRDPRLGMACGTPCYVEPGTLDAALELRPPGPAEGVYDGLTGLVRSLESRTGRLFSVHGQLLAWRAALRLAPNFGFAADDLDLMLALRRSTALARRVQLVPEAVFYEAKTPAGPAADEQALRRARAFVQIARALQRKPEPAGAEPDRATRLQFLAYRTLPLAAPWIALALALALALAALMLGGPAALLATLAVLGVFLLSPPGRRLLAIFTVIVKATRLERETPLGERWEMARR